MSGKTEAEDPGIKHDESKTRWSLLPWSSLREIAKVFTYGARKYSDSNYLRVQNARQRYFDACHRHLDAWWDGEELDQESGLHHLAHLASNAIILLAITLSEKKPQQSVV